MYLFEDTSIKPGICFDKNKNSFQAGSLSARKQHARYRRVEFYGFATTEKTTATEIKLFFSRKCPLRFILTQL